MEAAGGGARQRQWWHLIPLSTRAWRRWQIVWEGPRLGFVAETGSFATMAALSTLFLLLCLAPYFYHFLPYPGMFLLFVHLRLCSNHLLLSAISTCSFFLCHLYSAWSRNSFVFCCLVFPSNVVLIYWVAFSLSCRTRCVSTWFAYIDYFAICFFLSHSVWPHNLYLSRMKNPDGHWVYCWCDVVG